MNNGHPAAFFDHYELLIICFSSGIFLREYTKQ